MKKKNCILIFKNDAVGDLTQSLNAIDNIIKNNYKDKPDVACFSISIWNEQLSLKIASYLKENYISLQDLSRVEFVSSNEFILPEISTYIVNGHTTGQQLIKIESQNEILYIV